MLHKHHIIPKHLGGSDNSDNIKLLTVEEHAEAHKILYETHGKIEDYLAWKGLSGQISKEEILKEIYKQNGKRWGKNNKGKIPPNKGIPMTEAQKVKLRKPKTEEHKLALKKPKSNTENMGQYERTEVVKEKLRVAAKKQFADKEYKKRHSDKMKSLRAKCVHCGFETIPSNIKRWHNDSCKKKPK